MKKLYFQPGADEDLKRMFYAELGLKEDDAPEQMAESAPAVKEKPVQNAVQKEKQEATKRPVSSANNENTFRRETAAVKPQERRSRTAAEWNRMKQQEAVPSVKVNSVPASGEANVSVPDKTESAKQNKKLSGDGRSFYSRENKKQEAAESPSRLKSSGWHLKVERMKRPPRSVQWSMRMDSEIDSIMRQGARENGMTLTELVRIACVELIDNHGMK